MRVRLSAAGAFHNRLELDAHEPMGMNSAGFLAF
jgi:hypothetical protein